ncbi:ABC transporter substrate-binding protein [Reyranella sp.]|uniref:ABC transporter substrate-binding protein n=1 Tax=Reyranella sp. TaxID=1929291 RepID=UPI0027306235|nr:ABC transporter substrate-binding protein [Reyranella sp.]MDP2378658.1 ABC transporter substrate-binding protein [Reyranella sp.]
MKRRILLAAAAVFAALPARAQTPQRPTIGVLMVRDEHYSAALMRAALQERGWTDGSYTLLTRSAGGSVDRLPALAAELVAANVDAIVALQTPAAAAAKRATQTIPIVSSSGDPVGAGLVDSLVRPGGNLTGVDGAAATLGAKRVELLREILPSMQRLAVLLNPTDPFNKPFLSQIQMSAATLALEVDPIAAKAGDLDPAFSRLQADRADAVIVQPSLPLAAIAARLRGMRLPSISQGRFYVESGGLMAIGANTAEIYRLLVFGLTQILKGTPPRDIPIMQPTQFDFFLNLTTAKALGLAPPPALVQRADEVLE